MIPTRKTRTIRVGPLQIGGSAPLAVQSMAATRTLDEPATRRQLELLDAAGADLIRIAVDSRADVEALARLAPATTTPLSVDLQENYRLAELVAPHVQKIRYNPGHLHHHERDKPVKEKVHWIAGVARAHDCAIRIGVNAGSLDPALYDKYGGPTPEAMVESAVQEMAYFHEVDFDLMKISVKASSVPLMVEAYRQLSTVTDVPLHLGVTEAGPPPAGLVKATAGIATLLLEGIGDTIRYSLTADPVEEARAGRQLLEALGLRERKNVDLIACPSCGRAEVDVIDVATRAMEAFGERKLPLQVAVMGCVVNGPGEAREADIGIAAGNKRGHLFVKGRNIAVVPEDEMVDALVEWAEFINQHGTDAAIDKADTARAEREAAKDRSSLLDAQGTDANHAGEKIVEIRKTISDS